MQMPGRKYTQTNSGYRYGFNGKEDDKDISDGGQDYGMRIYDTRIGKFLSMDLVQLKYPTNPILCLRFVCLALHQFPNRESTRQNRRTV